MALTKARLLKHDFPVHGLLPLNKIRRLRPPYLRRLKVRLRGSFPLEARGSRGLWPNLFILDKGAITSLSLFMPFSSNMGRRRKEPYHTSTMSYTHTYHSAELM